MKLTGKHLLILILLAGAILTGGLLYIKSANGSGLAKINSVNTKELPQTWQGLSDAELRVKVEEMLSERLGERKFWWGGPFEQEECRQLRMAALILDDQQLGVRSLCWLAHKLQFDSNQVLAIKYLEVAITEAQEAGLNEELARCYNQKGNCLEWLDLYEWALEAYTRAYEITQALDDPDRESYYLIQMATLNDHRLLRYEAADVLYQQLPALAGRGLEPQSMIPKYDLWGLSLQSSGRYADAIEAFELALEAAEKSGKAERVHSTLELLAEVNLGLNRNIEGEAQLQRACELEPSLERCTAWFDPQRTLASHYIWTERSDEAEALLQDTLDRIEKFEATAVGTDREEYAHSEMRSERVKTLAMLADLKSRQGNLQQALEYLLQADRLNDGIDWLLPQEDMALPLAQAYLKLGRLQDARDRLDKPNENELTKFMPDAERGNPELLRMQGEIQLAQGNWQEAEEYLQSALDACAPVRTPEVLVQKSGILLAMGRLAEQNLDKAGAEADYQQAFNELLASTPEFQWNTMLKTTLADEIDAAGQSLIELYESQGRQTEVDNIRHTLDLVRAAQAFARQYTHLSNAEAEHAFRNYRTANTYLTTLSFALYWKTGVGLEEIDERIKQLQNEQGLDTKYRREQNRQLQALRTEVEEKIAGLETAAANYLTELRRLDPETAAIIEIQSAGE